MASQETSAVRVAVRVRPMASQEIAEGCTRCVRQPPSEPVICLGDHTFTYDHVFDARCTQSALYAEAVEPLVERCVEGFNATVFAYGQTGSGKTYTMGGAAAGKDVGVIPRAATSIFDRIAAKAEECPEIAFSVSVSYLELYREDLRDLLRPAANQKSLPMRENDRGEVFVAGLHRESVTSVDDVLRMLERGSMCRSVGATLMNVTSSRSHAVFSIFVDQRAKPVAAVAAEEGAAEGAAALPPPPPVEAAPLYKTARFNLVDLAGSERAKRTGAGGTRLAEGIAINSGLLALGNVISALGDAKKRRAKGAHVPYRTSKLTRLLQDSLGGNSHTLMLACVSPADSSFQETLTTLRYANRARNIKNKPKANVDEGAAALGALQRQVQALQVLLVNERKRNRSNAGGSGGGARSGGGASSGGADRAQMRQLIDDLDSVTTQLRAATEERDRWRLRCENAQHAPRAATDENMSSSTPEGGSGGGGAIDAAQEEQQMGVIKSHLTRIAVLEKENAQLRASGGTTMAEQADAENSTSDAAAAAAAAAAANGQREEVMTTLSSELTNKEELLNKVQAGAAELDVLRIRFRSQMSDMEHEVKTLQSERATLLNRLHGDVSSSSKGGKVSEERAAQLKKQLRARAAVLKQKEQLLAAKKKEISQLAKMKSAAEQKAEVLRNEMAQLKKQKADAAVAMKHAQQRWRQQKGNLQKAVKQADRENMDKAKKMKKLERQQVKQGDALRRKVEESSILRQQQKNLQSKLNQFRKENSRRGNRVHSKASQQQQQQQRGARRGAGSGSSGSARVSKDSTEKMVRSVVRAMRASAEAQEKVETCKAQRMEKAQRRKQIKAMLDSSSLSAAGVAALKSELSAIVRDIGVSTAEIGVLCRESAAAEDAAQLGLKRTMKSVSEIKQARAMLEKVLLLHAESAGRCRVAEKGRKAATKACSKLEMTMQRQENVQRRKVESIESAYEEKVLYLLKQLSGSQQSASGSMSSNSRLLVDVDGSSSSLSDAVTPRMATAATSDRTAVKANKPTDAARTAVKAKAAPEAVRTAMKATPIRAFSAITLVQRGGAGVVDAPRTVVKPKEAQEEEEEEYESEEEEYESESESYSEEESDEWTPGVETAGGRRKSKAALQQQTDSILLSVSMAGGGMSYRELQKACKSLGLCAVGKKVDLQRRLDEHREAVAAADPSFTLSAAPKPKAVAPKAVAEVPEAAAKHVAAAPAAAKKKQKKKTAVATTSTAPRSVLASLGSGTNSLLGIGAATKKQQKQKTKTKAPVAAAPARKRKMFSERKFGGLAARVNAGSKRPGLAARRTVDKENAVRRFAR